MFRHVSLIVAAAALSVLAFGSVASASRDTAKSLSGRNLSHPGAWATGRELVHTFPTFNQVVYNEPIAGLAEESLELTGMPAGTYTSYQVTMDWGGSVNEAWSSEALWALSDASTIDTTSVFYADPGSSLDSFNDPLPASLAWTGYFDTPYTVPTSGSLYFLMAQQFNDSGATWSNVSITLDDALVTPPVAVQAYLDNNRSTSAPISAAQVLWYVFDYSGTGDINLSTAGSTLTASSFGSANDTEMALYDSVGSMIETNDDTDFAADILTSNLSFASGELPAGTYYVAVSGFNGTFANAFGVSSNSISTGTIVLNGLYVPEPTSLALMGIGCTLIRRRR